ncbi:2-dehydro-3-deoxygalactonokinase [Vibrio sp. FNV 38]|nr:2-dehydro-3-deoxygalactonokinase [Vibrio sp. FNV 38]
MGEAQSEVAWLMIDWGTTNFRAFAMNQRGQEIDRIEKDIGLLSIAKGQFSNELKAVLRDWIPSYHHLPVFMAGMVGSQQGWYDVPYMITPARIGDVARNSYEFDLEWGAKATIYPGVKHMHSLGQYDVMRGEEVQLIGAQSLIDKDSFHAVLPGTHSKYANVQNGAIQSFSTYMTGEMYSVISKHTILGKGLVPVQESPNSVAFLKGVEESNVEGLTNQLFMARTHRLFKQLENDDVLDYLSGLLIGHEVKSIVSMIHCRKEPLNLIGNYKLSKKYELALNSLGFISQVLDGEECFIEGMRQLEKENEHEKLDVL